MKKTHGRLPEISGIAQDHSEVMSLSLTCYGVYVNSHVMTAYQAIAFEEE
jgi:hypothetical protein